MRLWLAFGVVVFGMVTLGAGAVAMYRAAIIADETGTSGWHPALWLVMLAGMGVVLFGIVLVADAVSWRAARSD
jgi:hypothetical protein